MFENKRTQTTPPCVGSPVTVADVVVTAAPTYTSLPPWKVPTPGAPPRCA
jgi:hypothetical protein